MEINRREFVVIPAAAVAGSLLAADAEVPWQRKIRRLGQLNMTEHDPVVLNVEEWADYWASLKIDAVMVSVTGIMAFYQTKVPFHRKGKFLGDRDFFGDCCAAAKKRGIHVIARMSPDLNWEDAVQAHPEWFQCDNHGRGGEDTPIWGCSLQGRVCNAVQKGKMATNVTAGWSTGVPRWRNVYKSPEEQQMWFDETLASGMVPYHHIVGG